MLLLLQSGSRLLKRYFTTLLPIYSTCYTIPTVTLAGDFEITLDFTSLSTGDEVLFSGELFNESTLIAQVQANGTVRMLAYAAGSQFRGFASLPGPYNDGVLHSAKFKKAGNAATVEVDGVVSGAAYWAEGSFNVAYFGVRAGQSSFFGGIVSNSEIIDNGTLIRDYKIDENFALTDVLHDSSGNNQHGQAFNITESEQYTLNQDSTEWIANDSLYLTGDWEDGSPKWSLANNVHTILSDGWGSLGFKSTSTIVQKNTTYVVEVAVVMSNGIVRVYSRNADNTGNTATELVSGHNKITINSESGGIWFDSSLGIGSTLSNISIKRIIEIAPSADISDVYSSTEIYENTEIFE